MIEREQVLAILHTLDERGYTVVTGAMSADNADAMRREEIERRLLCWHQLQSRRGGRHQQGDAP